MTKDFVKMPSMAAKPNRPTKLELTILRVLWEKGPGSVREIQAVLNESRETGYTTVLKMLQIMHEKGLVERDETTRPQIYRAKHSEQQTQRQLLKDLVQLAFGGSVKALVMQALATKRSSPEDLEAIEKLLDSKEVRNDTVIPGSEHRLAAFHLAGDCCRDFPRRRLVRVEKALAECSVRGELRGSGGNGSGADRYCLGRV
jgi:predicted transcriptional regulator